MYQAIARGIKPADEEAPRASIARKVLRLMRDEGWTRPTVAIDAVTREPAATGSADGALQREMPNLCDWLEAQRMGQLGEGLVNRHFERQKADRKIRDFKWVSKDRTTEPADFWRAPNNGNDEWVEVKSTGDKFEKAFFISPAELERAVAGKPYRIYRVYETEDDRGKLRVSKNFEGLAQVILNAAAALPSGVTAVAFKIDALKAGIEFAPEISMMPS